MIYNENQRYPTENNDLDIPAYFILVYFGLFGLYIILTGENVKRQL
jgi:hypothetical protein